MKVFGFIKKVAYIIRSYFVVPFGPVTIHLSDKSAYTRCYYDYKRNVWTCPKKDIFFTKDKVLYWHRPKKDKVFCYIDKDEEDDDD